MNWLLLQFLTLVYVVGLLLLQRQRWQLAHYVWGAFGLTFLFIHLSLLQGWNDILSAVEARHVQGIVGLFGVHLQVFEGATLLVPDSDGWTGLQVGVECSTLIELSVFTGLILFYPRFSLQTRWKTLAIGAVGTYGLNLLRILIIVLMVVIWGKPVVLIAHAIVARLIYFGGIVALYWFLLTRPSLTFIRRSIESTGRAVT